MQNNIVLNYKLIQNNTANKYKCNARKVKFCQQRRIYRTTNHILYSTQVQRNFKNTEKQGETEQVADVSYVIDCFERDLNITLYGSVTMVTLPNKVIFLTRVPSLST